MFSERQIPAAKGDGSAHAEGDVSRIVHEHLIALCAHDMHTALLAMGSAIFGRPFSAHLCQRVVIWLTTALLLESPVSMERSTTSRP